LPEVVEKHYRPGDVILVLGAGDIDAAVGRIVAGI
jgi:UDP-N-acetylmuramate-alanine ligase